MTHKFEVHEGATGMVCTALVPSGPDGHGEDCGRPPEHEIHAVDPEPADTTGALLAQRGALYGGAVEGMARVAQAWSGVLGHEVTGHQVALCMAALKLVRADSSPDHQDHYDDARGYLAIAEQVVESWDQ